MLLYSVPHSSLPCFLHIYVSDTHGGEGINRELEQIISRKVAFVPEWLIEWAERTHSPAEETALRDQLIHPTALEDRLDVFERTPGVQLPARGHLQDRLNVRANVSERLNGANVTESLEGVLELKSGVAEKSLDALVLATQWYCEALAGVLWNEALGVLTDRSFRR